MKGWAQISSLLDNDLEDFMLEFTKEEYNSLRSQFGTLKRGKHSKYMPMSFTEQGIAMKT
jgi:hypothetical protein